MARECGVPAETILTRGKGVLIMSTVLRMARRSDPIYVLPYRDTEDEDDAGDDSYEGVLCVT